MTTRTQIQIEWGTAAEVAAFTGVARELVVDTTNYALVIMDGTTVGGKRQASESYVQTQVASVTAGASNYMMLADTCV